MLFRSSKEFIANPNDEPNPPEKHVKNIPLLGGDCRITENHVISVQNDVGTSYQTYISVQNELVAAYNNFATNWQRPSSGKSSKNAVKHSRMRSSYSIRKRFRKLNQENILQNDPKIIAAKNMDIFPVEINSAPYIELIRATQIGRASCRERV